MLIFTITQQRYKGHQSKKLCINIKIRENGNNQLWNNIHIYMVDRAATKQRYFNFKPSFKLRWCRARDLLGSQIPVTTGGFEL